MNYFEALLYGFACLDVGLYLLTVLLVGPALVLYLIFRLVRWTRRRPVEKGL